jgi:hypothetical protein
MQIPFVGGAYTSRSSSVNAQTCVNLFPVVDNQSAKTVLSLFGTPGLVLFKEVIAGSGLPVRAIHVLDKYLYVIVLDKVYKVSDLGSTTLLGSITTRHGFASMKDNGTQILIVDETNSPFWIEDGVLYDLNNFTKTVSKDATSGTITGSSIITTVTLVSGGSSYLDGFHVMTVVQSEGQNGVPAYSGTVAVEVVAGVITAVSGILTHGIGYLTASSLSLLSSDGTGSGATVDIVAEVRVANNDTIGVNGTTFRFVESPGIASVVLAAGGSGYPSTATSTTSITVKADQQIFETQAGLSCAVGDIVKITSTTDSTVWLSGFVISYTGTTLTVYISSINGTGTYANWTIAFKNVQTMLVEQDGAFGGTVDVLVSNGVVTGIMSVITPGAGYTVADGLDLLPISGSGSGAKVNITTLEETDSSSVVLGDTDEHTMDNLVTVINAADIDITASHSSYTLTLVRGSFPVAAAAEFQDGFFIIVEKDTANFYKSGLYDVTAWNMAEYATVEGRSSNLLTAISNTQDLWFFGETAAEVYQDTGAADFPFTRIPGALIDAGCGAKASPCKINGILYWLTDLGQICCNAGYTAVKFLSTPEIDYQISTYSTIDDAIGMSCNVDGHAWYVLTFPTMNKTWVYDTITGFFFEWKSYVDTAIVGRHRINCTAQFGRQQIIGDYDNGKLYIVDMTAHTDDGQAIKWQRATPTISKDRLRIIYHQLEVEFEAGVGLSGGVQGTDPQVLLDWSDDGGKTWSNQHSRSIGKIGKYKNRARWTRLGMSRNRIFRISGSDPVKTVIIGAYALVEECKE